MCMPENPTRYLKTKTLTVANNCWEPLSQVLGWFKTDLIDVLEDVVMEEYAGVPTSSQLTLAILFKNVSAETMTTFRSLVGLITLLSLQRETFLHLHAVFSHLLNASV